MSKRKEKIPFNVKAEQTRLVTMWPMLQQQLHNQLIEGQPDTIATLSKLLPEPKYPYFPKKTHHCVICHGMYDPQWPEECKIMHDSEQNQKRESIDATGSV